ncbi:MAG: alanine--tRNA ligase [Bacteroidales bacterium]|jgi:alanyl-tRNA synthetase|nr:alanine--tRNA ligase [Bacteroidales bacterium]
MDSRELRRAFFNFFESKKHTIVESAPMVLKHDPTLMFTNAGMNQFKDIFLGNEKPSTLRVANSQKCLRVSGKHNDLEEVGHDTYHHTMFEMLGNWSFGDYFKKEAIEWAWEFLTSVLNIPEERIYTTVFEGNEDEKLERDNEAEEFWKKCFKNPGNRILEGSKKDNFWEMGDSGPCGPCSEIHVDLREDKEREKVAGHELVNKNHPLVIEIWNLVFIQYNRKSDGSLEQLPDKHVDTGMGFERLCMVVQNKKSNYDTDIFQSIISEISGITGISYGAGKNTDTALRVIADHLRAVSFSIADGQLPSNNKAGYVIRRILRRAIRYAYNYLGQEEPFIYRLVPVLVNIMGDYFHEIKAQQKQIASIIRQEEITFLNTLGKGMKLIDRRIDELQDKNQDIFPGKDAFILYDTYGFPLDLTQLILKENKMTVDTEGFDEEMKKQKQRSKTDAVKETGDWTIIDAKKGTDFTGYEKTSDRVKITRYRKVKLKGEEFYHLVFDRTPFYAESGGQAGDTGYITNGSEKIDIINTIKENKLIVHVSKAAPRDTEDYYQAVVDRQQRSATAKNHTATHLLHHALRKVLGDHVEQKGSLVTAEKLRFDFSHFRKISREEIDEVEKLVNKMVRENIPATVIDELPVDEALEKGAIALFGEKYDSRVRVVGFDESLELCGGTHVESTGQIGLFKIISESAIAAGIRRIEAVTSEHALDYVNNRLAILDQVSNMLTSSSDIPESISKLISQVGKLNKRIEKLEANATTLIRDELLSKSEDINGVQFIAQQVQTDSLDILKKIAQMIRTSNKGIVLAIGSQIGDKAHLLIMVSDDIVKIKKIHAGDIVNKAAKYINGGGGGQAFMAVAGGNQPEGIPQALDYIKKTVSENLL